MDDLVDAWLNRLTTMIQHEREKVLYKKVTVLPVRTPGRAFRLPAGRRFRVQNAASLDDLLPDVPELPRMLAEKAEAAASGFEVVPMRSGCHPFKGVTMGIWLHDIIKRKLIGCLVRKARIDMSIHCLCRNSAQHG